ncbi:MAG: manganese efflux pump [Alistipes sp.]|nr:manganese efflux pump [Alistipes sp.]
MTIFDLTLLAVGVSMDAFAVSIAKGLATPSVRPKHYLSVALWFGGFQALMPLIGYFIGANFITKVEQFDHWIAFALLAVIGGKMLYDCIFGNEEEVNLGTSYNFKTMLLLAVATSIDALAVGVSLAVLKVDIWVAVAFIGATTALFSAFGLRLGNMFGSRYKRGAEITGGVVLIAIGIKILIEHIA